MTPILLETCLKLLKLMQQIGDDEGHNKKFKEGTSTHESKKWHTKQEVKIEACMD